jgi:hypothetical protein
MSDRPQEMYRNQRPVVPEFDAEEWFYHGIEPNFVDPNGTIDPVHIGSIQCPDLSSNRSRFSEPWYVLYPRDLHGDWAVFKFRRQDVPSIIKRDAPSATPYQVKTEHDPYEDNYGHCETRVYRDGTRMRANQVKQEAKNKLRLSFSKILFLERKPGELFPPASS